MCNLIGDRLSNPNISDRVGNDDRIRQNVSDES